MAIGSVSRKESVGSAARAGAPQASAATLAMSTDSFRFTRRDGAADASSKEVPGLKKMQWGGTLAAASMFGVIGCVLAAAALPVWAPWVAGAGVVVGAGIMLKGVKEWADDYFGKLNERNNSLLKSLEN
ncbi:MAG: hypothetical protein FJZ00_04755 [Candidatus Sericytochromatia bacterium]|uniref:Uncharacterized protein n=1 Tax=Candidatus Tanganyikabacteria bacterium TaxID=2961651 RepID=A0A937X540_9BACT|nr:hypothetical protein [Candidatus Tanganyikabacteria bacterium]